jgi:8-oxo-dGTP diphosphatase
MKTMKSIRVACAIIQFGPRVLAVQRSARMSLPLQWEFPGGKIEAGETVSDCILREIREELNLEIRITHELEPVLHQYPDFLIELNPVMAISTGGIIQLLEHEQFQLLPPADLNQLDWAAADRPIVDWLMQAPPQFFIPD